MAEFVYLRSGNVKMEKMMEQQQLKKCPIGIQTFEKIIEGNYLYVDKTEYVYRMVHGASNYCFLSRPRRFGKSLLTSTLHSYFAGKKDLFRGLAIEKLETEWTEYPVLHFDMSLAKYNPQIQISAESGTKRSIFRQKNKTKRSKKRLHTTLIKPEQKVNEDLCSGFIVS